MKTLGTLALIWTTLLFSQANAATQPLAATVQAPMQQWPSISGAWIDSAFLTGSKPRTVQVRQADASGTLLPARLDLIHGAYRVLWEVPGTGKKEQVGQTQSFVITLDADQPSPKLDASATNLVYNGGFERLDKSGVPKGMSINANVFRKRFHLEQENGNHSITFNAPKKGRNGPIYLTPAIAVTAGKAYVGSFRYRIQGGEAGSARLTLSSTINFYDAHGKQLSFVRAMYTNALNTDGWQSYEITVTAPANAVSARWSLYNRSKAANAVAVDDLRLAPAALAEVTQMTADGHKIALIVQSPNVRRFDLGPDKSPLWKGFTALTPDNKYEAKTGFGFTRLIVPRAINAVRPESLSGDFISARDARLRVDLPAGKYKVWMLCGDSEVGQTVLRLYFDSAIGLNGKEVWTSRTTPAEYFGKDGDYWRYYRTFWTPGMDYYDAFVQPHFQMRSFETQVMKDHLEITWRNLPVDAILIAPADQAEAMQRELAALDQQRRRATKINEEPGPVEPMPKVSEADQQRGFILFRRPAGDLVYPSSRPRADERIDHLQTFAAPGQGESVNFSLLPLKDLGDISVQATDLAGDAGTIAASAVDVRVVRYVYQEIGRVKRLLRPEYKYQVAPFALDHHKSVPGKKGITWSWWATIRVPEGTAPGIYQGALTIHSANAEPMKLPLRVRVLPFKLAALPIAQGYYYFPSEPWYSTFWGGNVNGPSYKNDPAVRQIIVRHETQELAFMKDLGLNSVAFSDDARGDVIPENGGLGLKKENRLALWMDLYTKAGMGPMPYYGFISFGSPGHLGRIDPAMKKQFSPAWDKGYRSYVQTVNKLAKARGWPEIIWYISDEASNDGQKGAEHALQLAKQLDDLPGVATIASLNGTPEHIMPAHLDISMPNVAFPITPQTIKLIHDGGSKLWIYNCGSDRLMLGLYPWRIDARGRFQWTYRSMVANPWNDLDGTYGETAYSISLPGPDGTIGTIRSEQVRAAINDHRYITTLQDVIAAAEKQAGKTKIVAQARQFLKDLQRRIPVDARAFVGYHVDPRETGNAVGGEFRNTDALNRVRWAAAQYILKLKGD